MIKCSVCKSICILKKNHKIPFCLICHKKTPQSISKHNSNPILCHSTYFCREFSKHMCTNCMRNVREIEVVTDSDKKFAQRDIMHDFCKHCRHGSYFPQNDLNIPLNYQKNSWSICNTDDNECSLFEIQNMCRVCTVHPCCINIENCDSEFLNAESPEERICHWKNIHPENIVEKISRTCGNSYCKSVIEHICPYCDRNPRQIMQVEKAANEYELPNTYQSVTMYTTNIRDEYDYLKQNFHSMIYIGKPFKLVSSKFTVIITNIDDENENDLYLDEEDSEEGRAEESEEREKGSEEDSEEGRAEEGSEEDSEEGRAEEGSEEDSEEGRTEESEEDTEYPVGIYSVKIKNEHIILRHNPTKNQNARLMYDLDDKNKYIISNQINTKDYNSDGLRKDILLQYCSLKCFQNSKNTKIQRILTLENRMKHFTLHHLGNIMDPEINTDKDKLRHVFMYYLTMFNVRPTNFTPNLFDIDKISEKAGSSGIVRFIIMILYYFRILPLQERRESLLFPILIDMQAYVHTNLIKDPSTKDEHIQNRNNFHTSLNAFIRQTEHANIKRGVAIAHVPQQAILFVFDKETRLLEMHNSNGLGEIDGKGVDRSPEAYFTKNINLLQSICAKDGNTFNTWYSPENTQTKPGSCGIWQIVRAMYRLKGIPKENMPSTEENIQNYGKCIFDEMKTKCLLPIFNDDNNSIYKIADALSQCTISKCNLSLKPFVTYQYCLQNNKIVGKRLFAKVSLDSITMENIVIDSLHNKKVFIDLFQKKIIWNNIIDKHKIGLYGQFYFKIKDYNLYYIEKRDEKSPPYWNPSFYNISQMTNSQFNQKHYVLKEEEQEEQ